jgi:hypothetical protein
MKKLLVFCYMLVAAIGGCGGDASNSRDLTKQEALAALSAADLGKIQIPFLDRLLDQGSGRVFIFFAQSPLDPTTFTVDRYAATKLKVAALFSARDYQILNDYKLHSQADVQINSRRAIVKLIQSADVISIYETSPDLIPSGVNDPLIKDFIALAKDDSCAEARGRLFLIDEKEIFLDKVGNCVDAAYSQNLYDLRSKNILCSSEVGIGEPKTSCADESSRNLFIQIIQNLEKADFGLGSEHQVIEIPLRTLPAIASNLLEHGSKFVSLGARLYYGETPDNIVIKDIASWNRFLQAGQIRPQYNSNALSVDFSKQMVLGVFLRTSSNCSVAQVLNWNSDGKKLQVEYVTQERTSLQSCDTQNSAASTPMNLVVINKTNLPIEFINVNAKQVEFSSLLGTKYFSYYVEPSDAIVRDGTSWAALRSSPPWNTILSQPSYSDIQTRNVDFAHRMLIGRLLGARSNGCSSLGEVNVWHNNGKLYVAHQETFPTSVIACTQSLVSLAYLIELPRTDEPIEFLTIPTSL